MRIRLIALAGLLLLLLAITLPFISSADQPTEVAALSYSGSDFPSGTGHGTAISSSGLMLVDSDISGIYTSPVLDTPIPFNVIIPQWTADVQGSNSIQILLRTAKRNDDWSEWYDIHTHPDWTELDAEEQVGNMIAVPADDGTHNLVQFTVSFGRAGDLPSPLLASLRLTLFDSTGGPTMDDLVQQQQALDIDRGISGIDSPGATDSFSRPSVISREVWCTHSDCDYSNGLHYEPVTNMVVHHTVTNNGSSNWAAIVRAIWSFHTYPNSPSCPGCRGWGDIGYNYLVDRDGIIYEGHNSQDYWNLDVIGTHAADANAGGMGVALIGTFTTPEEYYVSGVPPQPMLDSATAIMAWKADQRNIDVYSATRMANMDWGLPNIMGHRDVYGGTATTCPGGEAHALLPWMRDRVASLIGYTDPRVYVDELSSQFTKSNNNWHEGPRGCGNNGHSYYTWSVTDPAQSTNWGEWRPNVPVNGRYEVEVYAPYCDTNSAETSGANYEIRHANGTSHVVVSHSDNIGLWMSLGEFDLFAGANSLIRLTDLTNTDSWKGVWFDAIRLRQLPPTVTNLQPAPSSWLKQRNVTFDWNISHPSAVQDTTLQVATDPGFTSILLSQNWSGAETSYSYSFTQDYAALYWRIILTTSAGSSSTSLPTSVGLDQLPPTSAVTAAHLNKVSGKYELFWSGTDSVAGISGYNIDYRPQEAGAWTGLLANTPLTSTLFTPPDPNQIYWFRSQATDKAGNVEPAHSGSGDLSSEQAIITYWPRAVNETPGSNGWLNNPSVDFSWVMTDVVDVASTSLRVASDANFNNVILSQDFSGAQTSYTSGAIQDSDEYHWKVSVAFNPPGAGATSVVSSPATTFGIDTVLPSSAMGTIYQLPGRYFVTWQGQDALAGIAAYNVDYLPDGDSVWVPWLTGTAATSQIFDPPDPGRLYWFRSQAVDAAGNLEPVLTTAIRNTGQAVPFPYTMIMPFVAVE